MQFYQMGTEQVAKNLNTDVSRGLANDEATARLKKYGRNVLPEKKPISALALFIHQFLSPLMIILLFAAGASVLLGEPGDAIVIGIAILINVVVGFLQEWKAERAAEALKSYEVAYCQVMRDGEVREVEAATLVPGDVVLLTAGTKVPADVRLTEVVDFQVEEALLTGESAAVTKSTETLKQEHAVADRTNMAYMGTFAVNGRAEGIVVETGLNSRLGEIAKLVAETEDALTPIQKQLKRFSWLLGGIMLSVAAIIAGVGIYSGMDFYEIVSVSIALAVAAVPEGLLVAVTVILAIGMQRMLKRKALVRKLVAAETLGSVSVICTDKTGTLTQGHISVVRAVTPKHDIGLDEHIPDEVYDLFVMGCLNNDAQVSPDLKTRIGYPTEIALVEAAYATKVDVAGKREKFKRVAEVPFSSDKKFMATVHVGPQTQRLIVKGAPEKVFEMCSFSEAEKKHLQAQALEMTSAGLRVLGIAYRDGTDFDLENDLQGLTIAGLVGMQDPLRPQAAQTVTELEEAGIRTVMVTGDHAETAASIARGAGIDVQDDGTVTGVELDDLSDHELSASIEKITVFARVNPRHKVRIVKAWQDHNRFVAMTGDGVNDAPALRAADIGVALGSGTDLAHEISDMVLLDNNLATIEAAVREGRIIFDNIRKVIVYLLVDSFSEIMLIGVAILVGLPTPLLAAQILWINLVSDGLPYVALTLEPGEPAIMLEKPRPVDEPIVNNDMKLMIFVIGLVTDVGLFCLYWLFYHQGYPLDHLRTIVFTGLSVDSLFYVFAVRSMRTSLFRMNPFSNPWMLPAVLVGLGTQLVAVYVPAMQKLFDTVPLNWIDWQIVVVLGALKLFVIEITKEILIRRRA